MAVSDAQKRAINKYQKKNYDEIKIRVRKGKREEIRQEINKLGYDNLSKFMLDATAEKIKREKEKRGINLMNDIKYQMEIAEEKH